MTHEIIHESGYGYSPLNFHVAKHDDEVHVELTYPPWTDADNISGKCRHVFVNQESVRASVGVRLHYDYQRDGFVVEQPKPKLVATGKNQYLEINEWIEAGFFQSWKFHDPPDRDWPQEAYDLADAEFEARLGA